jgi:hypothetical protein
MEQTPEAIAQNLAEQLCWQAARRDDSQVARRLYRKQVVDGVYRLGEGALLDDIFHAAWWHGRPRKSAPCARELPSPDSQHQCASWGASMA